MLLYHGTSSVHIDSFKKEVKSNTWGTPILSHALRLAEKTCIRDGGNPIILTIVGNWVRIKNHNPPSFRLERDGKLLSKIKLMETLC